MQKKIHENLYNRKIIVFIGLMGVGKTTLGAKLAERLGYYFIDSDQEIEDREKRTIAEIFEKNGEKYFREVEKKIICEIVLRDEEIVLSLGGGAFIDDETRKILKEKTITIWLEANIDDILLRVAGKNNRPLLKQKNRRMILEELAAKRYSTYAEADFRLNTSEESHDVLLKKILKELGKKNEK
jgi:shikimate kinase